MKSVLETYFNQQKELGYPSYYVSAIKETSFKEQQPQEDVVNVVNHVQRSTITPNQPLLTTREQLASLYYECKDCTICHLSQQRNHFVFGGGSVETDIVVVGDFPGNEDDQQGLPFKGPSGELLTKMLSAINLDREKLFLTNVLKCRTLGNRTLTQEEAQSCMPILRRQLAIIKPKIILSLGTAPLQYLTGNSLSIEQSHGELFDANGTPLFVTYHPQELLEKLSLKRKAWADLQKFQTIIKEF